MKIRNYFEVTALTEADVTDEVKAELAEQRDRLLVMIGEVRARKAMVIDDDEFIDLGWELDYLSNLLSAISSWIPRFQTPDYHGGEAGLEVTNE
jgi:hypothetical protein